MYLRRCHRSRKTEHIYWELVESYRTERGPRQRVVTYLGDVGEAERSGVEQLAAGRSGWQSRLFDESLEPEWVEVDTRRVRAEKVRDFGGYWLGLHACDGLDLLSFLDSIEKGREEIPWSMMAMVLVLMRLCEPSSELRIAEHLYERTALSDLLGIPVRVTISPRTLEKGSVEVKKRAEKESELVRLDGVVARLRELIS